MTIQAGTRLGPYEIQSALGAGGMGEVYRARDTRLDRIVAIKVLPAHVAEDPERRSRFEREARTISALNHPHICALYDVGEAHLPATDPAAASARRVSFLVMEYVEGETVAARLERGALPPHLVLRHATEMADALDKAHRLGIVHRDLKPANVMLTKAGVKLLDFGLAKIAAAPAGAGVSLLPTEQGGLTAEGTILGTLHYMAPEQVEGREADRRTDIFAFGTLVYEMATGRRAFDGRSQASVIAAILDAEPPAISTLQPLAPAALDHVVRRCMAKDPDERWQNAHDLASELRWIAEGGSQPGARIEAPARRRVWSMPIAIGVTGVLVGAAAIGAAWMRARDTVAPTSLVRAAIPLPAAGALGNARPSVAISPDGRQIVFTAVESGVSRLYVRAIDRIDATPIRGTESAQGPFFSPDGQWLGFFANGRLQKVTLSGGTPAVICETTDVRGATWAPDDTIFFSPRLDAGLWRVSAGGGTPQMVTTPDATLREKTHRFPEVLPGGKAILMTIGTHDIASFADARIAVHSLTDNTRKVLIEGGSAARYSPTGHLVYGRGDTLTAVPFDLDRLDVTGPPVPLVENVAVGTDYGRVEYALANNGTLIYLTGGETSLVAKLVWVDRQGHVTPAGSTMRLFLAPQVSPDGQRVLTRIGGANDAAWIYDARRDSLTRLTFAGNALSAVWTPDGRRVVYSMVDEIGWMAADGSGQEESLFRDEHQKNAITVSPDGQTIVFQTTRPDTRLDLWMFSMKDRKAKPWLATRFNETVPRFSPDGRWLTYVSNETGRPEVYVRPFPGPGTKSQVSTNGGTIPVWSSNGRELFFKSGTDMMAVDVTSGAAFDAGSPRVLFRSPPQASDFFDVAPDGRRFIMSQAEPQPTPTHVNLVLGWFDELNHRVVGKR